MEKIDIVEFDFENEQDIDKALRVLKQAFPNGSFTKEWWNWKYRDTPFGKPLGWVAKIEGYDGFAGLRLLWPWVFHKDEKEITLYQTCDTATSPEFLRRGIMSKLTNRALKDVYQLNSFLYGFQNSAKTFSYQTYKKLGADDLGKVKWQIYPVNKNPYKLIKKLTYKEINQNCNLPMKYSIQNFMSDLKMEKNVYSTKWTNEVITWRFKKNPFKKYYFYEIEGSVVFYKIVKRKNFTEAQILLSSINSNKFIKQFSSFLNKYDFDFITYNALNTNMNKYLDNLLLSFNYKSFMNYVKIDHNSICDGTMRLELAETDFG